MKKIKDMLRRIGTAGLAAIMLTAQMPVTAFAEEIAQPQEIVVSDEVLPTKVQTDDVLPGESGGGIIEGAASEESGEDIANTSKTGDEAVQAGETPLTEKEASEETADEESSDTVEKQEEGADEQKAQESDKKDTDGDKEKKEQTASEEEERPAFKASKSIDGVRITVEADEGVFPEGATLSVEKVTLAQEKQAEEAVESERGEDKQVAASYTYDIKVLDKDGNEIQPADESKVKVSFKLEEVADSNLETNIYHIKEADSDGNVSGERSGNDKADSGETSEASGADSDNKVSDNMQLIAEKLPIETDGDTAIAETDGFSLYTVEFTYDNKQYVLPGDSEVALSEVLDTVGLTGEVSDVEVSDESLFSAKKCKTAEDGNTPEKDGDGKAIEDENGTWFVFAHQAFSSKEWMKVTIGGVVYEITVTDEQATAQNTAVVINTSNKSAYEGKTITGTVPSSSYAGDHRNFISQGAIVVDGIDLNLTIENFTADYSAFNTSGTTKASGISLVNGAKLHLTLKGTNTLKGGYGGAGIAVPAGCTLEITAASTGSLIATGGNEMGGGAGIGSIGDNNKIGQQAYMIFPQGCGTIIINGGTITAQGGSWYKGSKAVSGAAGIGSSELSGQSSSTTWGSTEYLNNVTGSITINDGTVKATGGISAAGIGGGASGTVKSISIRNGNVTAIRGSDSPAAIGTGWNSSGDSETLTCPIITIEHGTVYAGGNIGFGAEFVAGSNVGDSYAFIGDADVTCTGTMNETNMPEVRNYRTINIPEGISAFKVYDPAGRNSVYSTQVSGSATLTLTAPEGCCLMLTGTVKPGAGTFYAYDGTTQSTQLASAASGMTGTPISAASSGRSLLLKHVTNISVGSGATYRSDYDLMVTVFKPGEKKTVTIGQIDGGTVTRDKASAEVGETVTLTVTPNEGSFIEEVYYNDGAKHTLSRSDEGTYPFKMPGYDVTVGARFGNARILDSGTITGLQAIYPHNNGNAISISYGVKAADDTVLNAATDYDAVIKNGSNETVTSVKDLGTYTLTVTGKGVYSGSLTRTFEVKTGLEGDGTTDKPYIIDSQGAWDLFANMVSGTSGYPQTDFSGKVVKLTQDISGISTIAGNESHSFSGTFDGGGNTMNLSIDANYTDGAAPFGYISDAAIKDLTVTGNVLGKTHTAGLVGFSQGTNIIDGCTVNAAVIFGRQAASKHIGGVVGHGKSSTLTIRNTSFGGTLWNDEAYAGGLMGWCDAGCSLTIENSLFRGTYIGTVPDHFHPIAIRDGDASVTTVDHGAYYTTPPTLTAVSNIVMSGTRVYNDIPDNEMFQQLTLADGYSYCIPANISGIETNYDHTGSDIDISYTLKAGNGTALTEGSDYTVTRSYTTVKDAGGYSITFTGKGDYAGSKTCYFTVGSGKPATPTSLSEDADIAYPGTGHYYVNMPHKNTTTLTFSNSDVNTFNVYDDGGKNGNVQWGDYNTNDYLKLTAPAGCTFTVSGSVDLREGKPTDQYVAVYDGHETTNTALANVGDKNTLGPVTSTGSTMMIHYYLGPNGSIFNTPGFALTVTINDPNKQYAVNVVTPENGSLSASSTTARAGAAIILTATPAAGYALDRLTVLDAAQQPVSVTNGQFIMPNGPVIAAAKFAPAHAHSFTYATSGATITATCDNADGYCELTDHKATLTINAPSESLTYDGAAKTATVTGDTATLGTPTISYTKDGAAFDGTPKDAGGYIASITVGDKKASLKYTIAPREVTLNWSNTEFTYDGSEHCPTATAGNLIDGDSCNVTVTGGQTNANADGTSHTAAATGLSNGNYKLPTEGLTKSFTIAKANPTVTAPTMVSDLTYSGQAQELVTAGSATGGEMHYAVTTDSAAPTAGTAYSATIPKATNAGTYYVWYKVKGDANHNDVSAQKVPATISKADSGSDTASTVQVQKGDSVDASVNIRGYVGTGAVRIGTPQVQPDNNPHVSISDIKLSDDKNNLTFKVSSVDGGTSEIIVTLKSDNYESFTLTVPVEVKAKTTEVKLEMPTNVETSVQDVQVSGLESLTNSLNGSSVKVELQVKPESEPSDGAIKTEMEKVVAKIFTDLDSNSVKKEYLDISVKQTVDNTVSRPADVKRVIDIAVKYDLTGKYNPVVVREHGGSVKGFTPLASKPATGNYQDGTYFVDRQNNTIHIYSRYFSTYTIAYTTVASYTVTFDAQGGDSVDPMVVAQNGTISTLPSTTRSGYNFDGWYTATSGGTKLTKGTPVTDNVTYYAHWTQNSSGGGDSGSGGSGDSGNSGGSGGSDTVTPPSITLEIKQKQNISSYLGTTYKKYQYSQKGIVSISSKGIITAKKAGTVKVTGCVKQGKNWVASGSSVTLTVEKPYFANKTLDASYAGQKLNAANNLKGVSQKPSSWQSSKSSVAAIDSSTGEITVLKGGSAKITAVFGSGSYAAKYSFNVKVNLPRISKKTATFITGGIVRLKMNNTKKPVTWSTDNSSIAAVSGTGEVTAKSAGQATITATVEGQKYDCTVTVRPPAIRKATMTIRAGRQARVGLKNTKLSAYQISWRSSDTSVARVDASGYVTGVAPGTAVISTTAGGATSSCTVTVRQ